MIRELHEAHSGIDLRTFGHGVWILLTTRASDPAARSWKENDACRRFNKESWFLSLLVFGPQHFQFE